MTSTKQKDSRECCTHELQQMWLSAQDLYIKPVNILAWKDS